MRREDGVPEHIFQEDGKQGRAFSTVLKDIFKTSYFRFYTIFNQFLHAQNAVYNLFLPIFLLIKKLHFSNTI